MRILSTNHWLLTIAVTTFILCTANGPVTKLSRPEPERVELWSSGITTGYTKVYLKRARMCTFGTQLMQKGGFHSLECRITRKEIKALRQLIKDDLRTFQPLSTWFGKRRVPDGSSVLLVAWRDKEVVLAIPPTDLRSKVPASGKQVYQKVDDITGLILKLEREYAKRSHPIPVPKDDVRMERFRSELKSVFAKSMPKERVGW